MAGGAEEPADEEAGGVGEEECHRISLIQEILDRFTHIGAFERLERITIPNGMKEELHYDWKQLEHSNSEHRRITTSAPPFKPFDLQMYRNASTPAILAHKSPAPSHIPSPTLQYSTSPIQHLTSSPHPQSHHLPPLLLHNTTPNHQAILLSSHSPTSPRNQESPRSRVLTARRLRHWYQVSSIFLLRSLSSDASILMMLEPRCVVSSTICRSVRFFASSTNSNPGQPRSQLTNILQHTLLNREQVFAKQENPRFRCSRVALTLISI